MYFNRGFSGGAGYETIQTPSGVGFYDVPGQADPGLIDPFKVANQQIEDSKSSNWSDVAKTLLTTGVQVYAQKQIQKNEKERGHLQPKNYELGSWTDVFKNPFGIFAPPQNTTQPNRNLDSTIIIVALFAVILVLIIAMRGR